MFSFQGTFESSKDSMKSHLPMGFQSIFKKWWAKDSLFCGKATAVATVHRTVAKSRLSSPFWRISLQNSVVPVLTPIRVFQEVVGQNGLEPSTSRLSVVCSSQLSYWPIIDFFFMVEISGIEPLTSCLQGRRSPSWAKPPFIRSTVSYISMYPLNWITHQVLKHFVLTLGRYK